jgi:hypothetical protein
MKRAVRWAAFVAMWSVAVWACSDPNPNNCDPEDLDRYGPTCLPSHNTAAPPPNPPPQPGADASDASDDAVDASDAADASDGDAARE